MKLELKHLSGYLPYKLKMEILDFPLSKVLGQGWISYDRLYESEDKCHQR